MITILLEIREIILRAYQKIRIVVNPVVKFFFALLVFSSINSSLGFDPKFTKISIVVILSVISAITPGAVMVLLAMLLILLQVYSINLFVAVLLLFIFIILYALLLRFSPKQAIVAVAIPVLAKYNLHYAVPILMGSISNPIAILPTICGVVVYHLLDVVKVAATRDISRKIDDVVELYTDIFDAIIANKQMIMMIAVFAIVITVVWFIRRFAFDYSFEISLGAGVMTNILGFLLADLKYDVTVSVGTLIIMSVISGAIAMICDYMKRVLDYTAVERVQFEDDDYYYYVKAVPKVNISLREMDIKHINRKAVDGEDYEYEEETEDEDYESDVSYDNSTAEKEDEDRDVKEYRPKSVKDQPKLLEKPADAEPLPDKDEDYEEDMILLDDDTTDDEQ
ncbi:MAG: hypothetical protein IKP88_14950 [Lachnospiraceae bacterium]|nr:hypothetical protein [Lachnospiraceae bacterium]